jgi:hypothetical protein
VQSSGFAGLRIGVTGAGGSFGQALLRQLHQQGASLVALRHGGAALELRDGAGALIPVETVAWQVGEEQQLTELLAKLQILVINHGINVMGARDREATRLSLEVNTLSALRLLELFLTSPNPGGQRREIWVNTSEAEVNPAFSPLYEISKRTLGRLKKIATTEQRHGRPLKDDPVFSARLARVEIELMALEMTNLRLLSVAEGGKAPGAMPSILKIKGTEILQSLSELMLQAVGPYGLLFERDEVGPEHAAGLAPLYCNLRKLSIFGGSNEIQKNIVSQMVLGL